MVKQYLGPNGEVDPLNIAFAADTIGETPFYLYDEATIITKCQEVLSMPNAFGLNPLYAMKANPTRAILQIPTRCGFGIDAGSMNEARRAKLAGINYNRIMLTTQEVPVSPMDRLDLSKMLAEGMKYNVCSFRQLENIAGIFQACGSVPLSMRVHPGVGSGESSTRNTGDKYSCFGVHLSDLKKVLDYAREKGIVFDTVHVHIGSGGDPQKWAENIDRELTIVTGFFPDATTVNFGGGLKEARMPDEKPADIRQLGNYAKKMIEFFYKETGRKLKVEVEPGTYIVANAGYIVTKLIDIKQTGPDGFEFLVQSGGMEVNTRPALYGSRHPLYVVSNNGEIISSEFNLEGFSREKDLRIVVGRCCESGDSQSLDEGHHIIPRVMAKPEIGDYVVIGGAGAYCSSMSPFNYNSHTQAPELLLRRSGRIDIIRKPQTLEQMIANEQKLEKDDPSPDNDEERAETGCSSNIGEGNKE
jgi:diaminopimelate decarboxylase